MVQCWGLQGYQGWLLGEFFFLQEESDAESYGKAQDRDSEDGTRAIESVGHYHYAVG
jgi:hypothetical protein